MQTTLTPPEEPPEELVLVGRYPTLEAAQDHGLVILAMGEACMVSPTGTPGEYTLHTEPEPVPKVLDELETYAVEQDDLRRAKIRPEPFDPFHFSAGWEVFLVWLASLLWVFHLQSQNPALVDRAASSSIGLLKLHEWWRPFTGLFLHADVPHLVGNILSGVIFGSLVSKSLGPLRGWALILLCGTAGNILTSLATFPEPFVSIGASTAVFAALGILTGLGFSTSLRLRSRTSWAKVAAPVLAGFVLLGWLGGGHAGTNTDVLGHVFGFGSGLVSGLVAGELRQRSVKNSLPDAL